MMKDSGRKHFVALTAAISMKFFNWDSCALALMATLWLSIVVGGGAFAAGDFQSIAKVDVWSEEVISGFPNTIHVDDNAPNDPGPYDPDISDPCEMGTLNHPFDTIQEGIDAAAMNDLVTVFPGTYTEAIDFLGKAITVSSAGDAAIIRAPDDYAVSFYTAETGSSVLKNFVICDSSIGIFIAGANPTITNVTIVKNEFGIVSYSGIATNIHSSIFWYNTDGDLYGDPYECRPKFCCIERAFPGKGNISIDPFFADPNNNDYHLRSSRGRYWPTHNVWVIDETSSPCIDAGDINLSPSPERYPNGGRINMGAYGDSYYASLSEWDICGDFNHDNSVDWADFAIFANHWLEPASD